MPQRSIVSSMCFCFGSSLSLCAPWAWYLLQILHWRQLVHLLIIMVLAVCPHWCFSQSPLLQLWGIRHFNVLVSYKSIQVTVNVTVSFCALRQLSAHQPAYKLYVTFNLLVHFCQSLARLTVPSLHYHLFHFPSASPARTLKNCQPFSLSCLFCVLLLSSNLLKPKRVQFIALSWTLHTWNRC